MIIDETNNEKETEIIMNAINDHLFELCLDAYGCHVIERVIAKYPENEISHLYKLVLDNFYLFANNANGVCVIKKIFSHSTNQITKDTLKEMVFSKCQELIHQNFGNYVIHVALDVINKTKTNKKILF